MSKWVHVTSQPCGPSSWTNQWQLGPNQVPQGWPWPSWAPKRDFMGQRGPFCGLQECCRGPLRGPSTWSRCGPPSWTNQWHLGPNQAPWGCPRASGATKRGFMGQSGPFWGPQECCRGLLRGRSTWYGCSPSSWTNQWHLGPNWAPRGCPRTSGALKRAYQGQNGPFWGPQECRSGLVWGPSTWYGCGPPSWTNQWHLGPNQAPGAAQGPQKGLFGPKWALLGAPGGYFLFGKQNG